MSIFRRRLMMHSRPYDAEVEYLESDGSAYINTNIKPKNTYTFDFKVAMLQSNYNCVFWGCRSSGNTSTVGMQCYLNLNSNQYGDGILHLFTTRIDAETNWSSGAGMTIGTMYTYSGITCSSDMYDMTYPITLFALNSIGTINASVGICRIGGWTAYNNGVKVMELIPVRKDNVGYMYDKVSGQLFGNANSGGAFICGPVKSYMNAIIPFEDAAVKAICVENWGGGTIAGEMTKAEAVAVTSFTGKFYNNQDITTFHELKYFTGLSDLRINNNDTSQFYSSTLAEVTVPPNMTDLYRAFKNTRKIVSLDLSNLTGDSIDLSEVAYCTSTKGKFNTVTLPRAKVNLSGAFRYTNLTTLNADGSDWSDSPNFSNTFYSVITLSTITGTIIGINQSISFSACPLTVASALVVLNGLSSTGSGKTCAFKASLQTTYEADTDFNAAVATATANGWTIAYA